MRPVRSQAWRLLPTRRDRTIHAHLNRLAEVLAEVRAEFTPNLWAAPATFGLGKGPSRRTLDVVQPALPVERLSDDGVEVVALGTPAQRRPDEIRLGDNRGGIAGAPSGDIHLEVDAGDAPDDVDDLA